MRISRPVNNTCSKSKIETQQEYVQGIKTQERRHWRRSGVFIVKFVYISHFFLVFQMMTLNMHLFAGRDIITSLH